MTWGIGTWVDDTGERVAWEIGDEEMGRDMGAAMATMKSLGLAPGDRVLWCSMLSEAGQFWPFNVASMVCGAQLSCADATSAEAQRVAMFCRQLSYRAVLGVTGALLDGLADLGADLAEVFGGVEVVGARPDAYERLVASGLRPWYFVLVGPAVAMGREPGGPAYVNQNEWQLDTDGDVVTVTNLLPRATEFRRARTAVRGRLVDGGVLPATAEVTT
jgi:hypothetical protein